MTHLEELHERMQQAAEADRELDAALWLALVPGVTRKATQVDHPAGPYVIDETRDATGRLIIVPSYTAEISSALHLMRVVLGQVDFEMKSGYLGPYSSFQIGKNHSFQRMSNRGDATRPDDEMALAICEAILCVLMTEAGK